MTWERVDEDRGRGGERGGSEEPARLGGCARHMHQGRRSFSRGPASDLVCARVRSWARQGTASRWPPLSWRHPWVPWNPRPRGPGSERRGAVDPRRPASPRTQGCLKAPGGGGVGGGEAMQRRARERERERENDGEASPCLPPRARRAPLHGGQPDPPPGDAQHRPAVHVRGLAGHAAGPRVRRARRRAGPDRGGRGARAARGRPL